MQAGKDGPRGATSGAAPSSPAVPGAALCWLEQAWLLAVLGGSW